MAQPPKLGQGLSALFGEEPRIHEHHLEKGTLLLDHIVPSEGQPRKSFDDDAMSLLVDSIKQSGILQPLLVRPASEGRYTIIAGERRWRASKLLGLLEVPVVIKACDDEEALTLGLVENIQRESLNPIEEAEAYQKLSQNFSKTQEDIAQSVGKSRSHVANTMRLLQLPAQVQDMIQKGQISSGHARALIGSQDPLTLAQKIIQEGLSVRQIEQWQRKMKQGINSHDSNKASDKAPNTTILSKLASQDERSEDPYWQQISQDDSEIAHMERHLSEVLRTGVRIKMSLDGGSITIYFRDISQMDAIVQKLSD